eukprot:7951968-Lingulodinium_polyedra.AAC.1
MEDLERAEQAAPSGVAIAVPALLTPRSKVKPKRFVSATEYYDWWCSAPRAAAQSQGAAGSSGTRQEEREQPQEPGP